MTCVRKPTGGPSHLPAIVSTAVGLLGGHAAAHLLVGAPRSGHESLITTTSGPGVSGMGVFSSWAPRTPPLLSQTVKVPVPTLKTSTQPENCPKW